MKLQNIIFPTADTCLIDGMYFYFSKGMEILSESMGDPAYIPLEKGSFLRTDTYFNALSADKWKKYTNARHFSVTLRLKGKVRVELYRKVQVSGAIEDVKLLETILTSEIGQETVEIPDSEVEGIVYFQLTALEPSVFYGGWYSCENQAERPIKIALDICTFKREEYILRNCRLLQDKANQDQDFRNFEIFIIDNAKTLKPESFPNQNLRIFPNANVGGAGGFTRGLIEIKQVAEKESITHALIMDDDILLEPEALFRTQAVLSLLKEEYQDAVIGGAMLRLDKKNIEVESGALWNQGDLISRKQGMDLSLPNACLYNEVEEPIDYTAWWYTCLPLSVVTEDNLPLPLFIRGDDVEYGLRNSRHIILMNGICVWHEPFENKYSSSAYYYVLRNQLIDNAIHDQVIEKKQFLQMIKNRVMEEIYMYRYRDAMLLLDAIEDYLKGIDWLKSTDGEQLHQEILKKSDRFLSREESQTFYDEESYQQSLHPNTHLSVLHKVIRRLSVNGTYLSAKRPVVTVPAVGNLEINVYRAGKVLNYDPSTQRGFLTEPNQEEMRSCVQRLKRVLAEAEGRYESVNEEYKKRYREITNLHFWRKYLGLSEA